VNWHIAVSDHILRNVKEIVPIASDTRLKRIYLSRYINTFKTSRNDNKIKIIHVGRINPGKGQLDAVVALKRLKDNDCDFEAHFLGSIDDQSYFNKIKRIIDEYYIADRVHFRGHVHDVTEYLQNSDIFLFPSHGEGMPHALIESLAVGLVPVTYDNTVFPEVQQLGFHIVLVKDRDTGVLSDQLYDVATHLPVHLEKSKINIKKYNDFFAPQIEKENYLRVLV
jgi:glycosyltransferase involved in cell wall biosynthesis